MNMQAFTARAAAVALLVGLLAVPARAQRAHVGPHGGYNFDGNRGLAGAQMLFPIAPQVELYPSFDYYFENGITRFAFSGDVKFRFPIGGGTAPYLGGGVNVLHTSTGGASGTDTGWDMIFGLESRRGVTHPYVEGRMPHHGGGSQFQMVAGLNITLF
jgi:hypothetical protein